MKVVIIIALIAASITAEEAGPQNSKYKLKKEVRAHIKKRVQEAAAGSAKQKLKAKHRQRQLVDGCPDYGGCVSTCANGKASKVMIPPQECAEFCRDNCDNLFN